MNPDGTVSESVEEPLCLQCGVNHVIPGDDYCGSCLTSWSDGGGPNGGADGSLSDGTAPSNDPNNGWSDGTLRKASMTPEEIRLAAYLAEVRAKYSEERLAELGREGHAIKNTDGTYSFPIEDRDDVESAIYAISKSGDSHDAVRQFVVARAQDLELMDLVPELWKAAMSPEAREVAEADENETTEEPVVDEAPDEEAPDEESSDERSDEELSEEARTERKQRKARHRSTPNPREEVRDSIVHFGLNDLKVTEIRTGLNGEITLQGTPIVYNRSYTVHDQFGSFRETMAASVAEGVLASPLRLDCRFLINHDGIPLGRTQSGTLELNNGSDGLQSVVHLDTRQTLANDLAIAIERGDITQMSCGFIVGEDEWSDDMTQRTIYRFSELLDVSAVTYPASPTTHIAIAQRMMQSAPLESRSRLRESIKVMNEIRAGRTFNAQNAQFILSALESLHEADDLDPQSFADRAQLLVGAHQRAAEALSNLTGLELEPTTDNSDGAVTPDNDPGEGIRSDDEAAELRRKAINLQRERMARRHFHG